MIPLGIIPKIFRFDGTLGWIFVLRDESLKMVLHFS
jgi:hypothetical protein